ncbi:fluoride efflux transporter CrcB [Bacteroides sp. CG01]|uniref:fluoride efflux transporter CrcB n=1 Tax=Bacteroides TaxID=816 RepID=UPI00259CD542|nr:MULTISPECIES: fluoride efflux transporter CrcB [Bacteroides]
MKEIVYIFIGGGVGSVLRYLAQISINERMSGIGFPFSWGTFIVNIAGSFLIGLFYSVSERWNLSMEMRLFLTTGLCGGFTTFSTFSNDGLSLLRGEFYSTFLLYALLSIGLGLVAVMAGGAAGKLLG